MNYTGVVLVLLLTKSYILNFIPHTLLITNENLFTNMTSIYMLK